MNRKWTALVAGAVLAGTIGVGVPGAAAPESFTVTIARDEFGVAHITAEDWWSLAYGQGYALAEDRACTVFDQMVKVRGERAQWFGPGENDEFVNSDFAYRHLGLWEEAPDRWGDQPERVQDVTEGYVAGFNAQVDEHGVSGWCAGEPWVAPITTQDLYAYTSDILLLASSRNLIEEIGSAQPPATPDGRRRRPADTAPTSSDQTHDLDLHHDLDLGLEFGAAPGASNAWAFGSDATASGGGLLLANPTSRGKASCASGSRT